MVGESLEPGFRQAVEKYTDEIFIPFIENLQMDERVKKSTKYEHKYDYYLGYVLGLWEGQNIQLFKSIFHKEITDSERFELEEIFDLRLSKIKDILKTKCNHNE